MSDNLLKVISINTWKCDGDYAPRMRLLARQLCDLRPQIVACQECFMTSGKDTNTILFLSTALKMNYVLTPARFKKRSFDNNATESYSGLGIMSHYPVKILKEVELPSTPEDGERKAQFAEIVIDEHHKVLLVNVHLTHLQDARALRLAQIEMIASEVLSTTGYDLQIICGDFNVENDSGELKHLNNLISARHCYEPDGDAQSKFNEAKNKFQINKMVDHILVLPNRAGHYPECTTASFVLNQPDPETGIYPSDHMGISATFNLDNS